MNRICERCGLDSDTTVGDLCSICLRYATEEVQVPPGATLSIDGKEYAYSQLSNEYRLATFIGSGQVHLQRLERGMTLNPPESFERWVTIPTVVIPADEIFKHDNN